MKIVMFTICAVLLSAWCRAQYFPEGVGYFQNFDSLDKGLPPGWQTDTNATRSSGGGAAALLSGPGTTTRWNNASAGFKNVASANGFSSFASATAALQTVAADRALGIRQTGSFGDPGGAFSFVLDNTYGLRDLKLELKLQSLDSGAGRNTGWELQYGLGYAPDTFITVATGLLSTGGFSWTNTPVNVSFGAALDDQRLPVHIRLATLSITSGGGSRTTTAIDDMSLQWTGVADAGRRPLPVSYYPAPGISGVPHGSPLRISFNRDINAGTTGNFYILNETDRMLQTLPATAAIATGGQLELPGVLLVPGQNYHVTYDSTIADTGGLFTYALDDTTAWRFRVEPAVAAILKENFDTACLVHGRLPEDWYAFSISGMETWDCHAPANASARMYGHSDSGYVPNEDWLCTPLLDLSSPDVAGISYHIYRSGKGAEPDVMVSHNYAGSGNPAAATWTRLPAIGPAADTGIWMSYEVPVPVIHKSSPLHIAFRYVSDTISGYELLLDSIMTRIRTAVPYSARQDYGFRVLGQNNGHIALQIQSPEAGNYLLDVFDMLGRKIYQTTIFLNEGAQNRDLDHIITDTGCFVFRLMSRQHRWVQLYQYNSY